MAELRGDQPNFLVTLPVDGFQVVGFEGVEELGTLTRFDLRVSTTDPDVDMKQIVNGPAHLVILTGDGTVDEKNRHFYGIVSDFGLVAGDGERFEYRLTLVPRLYLATLNRTYRIYQEKTAPEIVQEILSGVLGLTGEDFEINLRGHTFPKRTYCTQYGESNFGYIARLLEEEGLFFWFRQDPRTRREVLVIDFDSREAEPTEPDPEVRYHSAGMIVGQGGERLSEIRLSRRVHPGQYVLDDYNPEEPERPYQQKRSLPDFSEIEVFEYPGGIERADDGAHYAQVRLERLAVRHEVLHAAGDFRSVAAGRKLKVRGYWRKDVNEREWLVTRVEHIGTQSLSGAQAGAATPTQYTCRLEAIPLTVPFRPARRYPKPRALGSQTGVVVGPAGEEIHVDSLARVKVHFRWDRFGTSDENASCWIRLAQDGAGPGYGQQHIPRIGHEVVVDFLDGDPDRPVIVGSVYNQVNSPVVTEKNKTQHSIKSFGNNSITFEDKPGAQCFSVNASKDYTLTVANDQKINVGNDSAMKIGANEKVEVGADSSLSVSGNRSETIGAGLTIDCAKWSVTVSGDDTLKVGGSQTINVGGSRTDSVGSSLTHSVGGAVTKNFGGALTQNVGGAATLNFGGATTINVGGALTIQAGGTITITGPGGSIEIGAAGVKVAGSKVSVQAQGQAEVKGATVSIDGGSVQVKGSIIQNN